MYDCKVTTHAYTRGSLLIKNMAGSTRFPEKTLCWAIFITSIDREVQFNSRYRDDNG